jgi:hypothetical protein
VLWKDSFALSHGEYAHSYQWLVAGLMLDWGANTAVYYKNTAGRRSRVPLFVKDTGHVGFHPANLWEWLVDCTKYDAGKFPPQAKAAADAWVDSELQKWAAGELTSVAFINAFFKSEDRMVTPAIKDKQKIGSKAYDEFWKGKRNKAGQNSVIAEIESASDIPKFKERLLKT